MRLGVGGGAAIGKHRDAIGQVGGITDGVVDGKLRRHPHHKEAVDVAGAQERIEVGVAEAAVAGAGHCDLAGLRLEASIRGGAPRAALDGAELGGLAEQARRPREVGIVVGEADVDMGDGPALGARHRKRVAARGEEGFGFRRVAVQ